MCVFRAEPQKRLRLPNELEVAYVSREDVLFLYKEIFEDKAYLKHGLTIREGDVVIDVGANIGMFSIFASEAVGKQVSML